MPPAPFDLPEELLEAALARLAGEAGQRVDAALAELVAAHPEHAEALRALRQALDGANRLLAQTVATPVPPSIGGHRVERRLGEGAFGTVYLCTQTQPIVRPVAVKVLRPGAGDRHTVRRFEAERQVLASLQHPTITHVYDAGYLPDGRPYFVMEHIDGSPITEYCNAHRLGCEARLRLLVQVCRGVEHAHSRGVVHRDLKPSNVLVVEATGEPLPKIIDFGIAKALAAGDGSDGQGPTTDAGRVLGTPGYMSPEQATARLDQIDERSDVFALGVMLYELLTGELPWPRGEGLGDVTPQLPSRRLRSIPHRSAAATQEAARVRGDLDWITRKATQAAREERYAGVRALADDLERHLAGLPVLAGPPSIAYRLRKLVQRNRVATWALAGAVLASAFGLAIAAWEGRTAEAGVRKATAAAAANFADAAAAVHKLLERAKDPALQQKPQSEGIRAALANDALGFFDQWLAARPQDAALRRKRCEALITLAEVHNLLGQYTDAQQRAEQANAEAQSLFDETPGDVPGRAVLAEALRKQHRALVFMGRHADARPLIEAAVAHYEQCAAADAVAHGVSYGRALSELGTLATMQKRTVDAEAAIRSAIAWLEGLVARDITPAEARSDLVRAKFALANVHVRAERWDEAERILLAVEKELDALTEGRLRVTTGMLRQQAIIKTMRGDHAGAVPLLERAVATGETWRRQEPQQALASSMLHSCLQDLAHAYDKLGEFAAGERTMRRIVEVGEERLATLPKGASFAAEQAKALFWFARKLWNRLRHEDLDLATTWLARARELATQTGDPPLWVVEATQALVADARGDADAARWERVATTMPAAPAPADQQWDSLAAEAWIAVARSRFDRADPGEAAAALERAEQHLDASTDAYVKNYRSEISWWRARLSLTAGDVDGAAPHVARLLELRSSWWGRWRAGDCEREAWQRLAATDPERARAHRDTAAGHYRSAIEGLAELVAKDPADPWPVVPWSLAQVGLAETAADRGETSTAVALLDMALAALARVEANAHRDAWDAPRVAAARALRERLVGR